ncbi:transcriptional regulator with XRE-family HTH domain [Bacilli bacterium PM5-3]|nr:transcriptional regulator with XRE-family HTH domain [Bacilli bacterium PM5-3]MDH6603128.1 transcriptional regulator with XRE-family HTH domain [Bacilli bacterium PM5-9]
MDSFENTREINDAIASNLKKIRKQKELSLDALSTLSGVSKSMLGQIERQESSPTVTTLWKISTALHISFTSLLADDKQDLKIVSKDKIKPLISDNGRFRLYPSFSYDNERNFEMLYIELDVGAVSESTAHERGTSEYVIVYSGEFEVEFENGSYTLKAGDALRYNADVAHTYKNISDEQTNICMIIYYE